MSSKWLLCIWIEPFKSTVKGADWGVDGHRVILKGFRLTFAKGHSGHTTGKANIRPDLNEEVRRTRFNTITCGKAIHFID